MESTERQLIWKEGYQNGPKKPRAAPISKDDWTAHRRMIHRKYMLEDLPLRKVVRYMKSHHNFHANERQYHVQFEKWGYAKKPNYKRAETSQPDSKTLAQSPVQLDQSNAVNEASKGIGADLLDTDSEPEELDGSSLKVGHTYDQSPFRQPQGGLTIVLSDTSISKPDNLPDVACVNQYEGLNHPSDSLVPDDIQTRHNEASASIIALNYALPQIDVSSTGDVELVETTAMIEALEMNPSQQTLEVVSTLLPRPSNLLDSILQDTYFRHGTSPISEDSINGLVKVANFLFAVGLYDEVFSLSKVTLQLACQTPGYSKSTMLIGSTPAWLIITRNLARSASSAGQFEYLTQVMNDITLTGTDYGAFSKDTSLLYAYLMRARFNWNKAAIDTTKISKSLQPKQSEAYYLSAPHILNPISEDLWCNASNDARSGYGGFTGFCPITHYTEDNSSRQDLEILLRWSRETLTEEKFQLIVSDLETRFWRLDGSVPEHDIRQFELILVYCHLCERFWELVRIHRVNVPGGATHADVIAALERLHQHTGLTHEDVFAALLRFASLTKPETVGKPDNATLRVRFCAVLNYLYIRHGMKDQILTAEKLVQYYRWPGQSSGTRHNFRDSQYDQSVRQFLQEFASVSFDQDISQCLVQVTDCLQNGVRGSGIIAADQSARSSQMSNDFAAFRSMAQQRKSNGSVISLASSLRVPTAGLNDLLPDASSIRRLLGYSVSLSSLRTGSMMSLSGSSIASRPRNSDQMVTASAAASIISVEM